MMLTLSYGYGGRPSHQTKHRFFVKAPTSEHRGGKKHERERERKKERAMKAETKS
jgi:hypothetical protein